LVCFLTQPKLGCFGDESTLSFISKRHSFLLEGATLLYTSSQVSVIFQFVSFGILFLIAFRRLHCWYFRILLCHTSSSACTTSIHKFSDE